MSEMTPELRERTDNTIRFLAIDAVARAGIGHVGAPVALARPAFHLFDRHLRFDPTDPEWPLRDRFVLSNGHASILQYSLLHLFGYAISLTDIQEFRTLKSKTPGHPEYGDTPGVELTTGPLGQGFAHGVGMALAGKLSASRFGIEGDGPGHHYVYGIVSDGDLMEGVSQEAASFAGHLGLGNLIYLYDDNQITIDGPTSISFSEDVRGRFEATGWHVQEIDGEDIDALDRALEAARDQSGKPSLIITRTVIGRGTGRAGKPSAHGGPYAAEEVEPAREAAGFPADPKFYVPDDVRAYCKQRSEAKREERVAADRAFDRWRGIHPERAAAWQSAREGRVPADLVEQLAAGTEGVDNPTRKHSAASLERLAAILPQMVGGSADLAGSGAPPLLEGRGTVGPGAEGDDPFAGANLHFGIREHAMAAITNGIALDGTFLPYSGTFLIFSDYMRPSIRLAALMKVRSLFIFTHDSIFVGEDGPTHQPIEQVDSLRSVPGLPVFRPADGVETALSYAWYAERAQGPVVFCFTRQGVPALDRRLPFELRDVWKGGYSVRGPEKPDVVLVASGSEVALSCEAADKLEADGVRARVVSVPCLELLLEQEESYIESLVPDDGTPLVAVEAGRAESLRCLVGRRGLVYGIDRFGASADYASLAEYFGFTPDKLAARVLDFVRG